MAVNQKIPSPDKVKKLPSQFSDSELEEIKKLKNSISEATFKLGQVSISKIKIQEQEDLLKNEINSLEKKEIQLAQKLSSKYGKGSLNLDTGEFNPIK
jgi:predicted FMN-binding regulatory protein PaiB